MVTECRPSGSGQVGLGVGLQTAGGGDFGGEILVPESIDLALATNCAQRYVGTSYQHVSHCIDLRKVDLYQCDAQVLSLATSFFFAVFDRHARRVGGTDYIAVSRDTGTVTELGRFGE